MESLTSLLSANVYNYHFLPLSYQFRKLVCFKIWRYMQQTHRKYFWQTSCFSLNCFLVVVSERQLVVALISSTLRVSSETLISLCLHGVDLLENL